jgi:NAD(P)-dependent dehydrogenase (short-subunit alcohol dehydrogenase family)
MTTMEGQRVVVVGGTSGMGLATVRATAALGASVVAAGRRPLAQREPIAGVEAAEVDVTDHESVEQLFRSVGELDPLLVTASPGKPGAFVEQDVATARSFMDGKFFGGWTCARYAVPGLRSTGSITFVTGGAVVRPPAHGSMITAAFAALEALTRPGDRPRPAARQRHPTRLHRQRHVVVPAPNEARRAAPACRRGNARQAHGHA